MDICVVCLENNGEVLSRIDINSKKWKENNMQHIIEKHMWWWFLRQPIHKEHKQWICQQCWQEITSFHQYAQRVKKSHKLYRVSMKKQILKVFNEAEPRKMSSENDIGIGTTEQENMELTPMMTEDVTQPPPLINIHKRKTLPTEQQVQVKKEQCYDMTDDSQPEPPVRENYEAILPNSEYSVGQLKDPLQQQQGNTTAPILSENNKSLDEIKSLLEQQIFLNRQIFNGINDLKNTVGKQNTKITNTLANQIASLKTSVTSHFENPKYTQLFPISSEEELYAFESMITEENQSEVVSSVKRVIGPKGIEKGICHIFSNELIFEYNVNGIYGKKRLLDYEKTINVLFLASSDNDTSLVEFNIQLRKAIKTAKNRYFKAECLKRKRVNDTNDTTFEIFEEDNSQSVQNEPGCSSYN